MSEAPSADVFKATAALILFSIALVGGILPRRLRNVGSKVVSCLNTAAGGVFFASAMVHMLPESSDTLQDAWGDVVPWGGFICSCGFLLILCIDQAVSISNANRKGRTGHTLVPTVSANETTPFLRRRRDVYWTSGEPPSDAEHLSKSLTGGGRRHRNTDSEEFAEIMSGISPHALLAPLAIDELGDDISDDHGVDGVGGGGGGSDRHLKGSLMGGEGQGRRMPSSDGGSPIGRGGGGGHTHGHGNGHGHGHGGHSHGLGGEGDGVWVRLALLLALSVHSVMEGLGVGAKSTKAYNLLFAIGVHKGLAAYALGASLMQSGVTGKQLTGFVVAFSAMTPIGILLGDLIEKDGEDDTAGAVCVALAAGTFLYVSLMEVLPPELSSTQHGWPKVGSLLAGFSASAGVGWLVG